MRRHVRALRHEAHVAKRAGFDDGLKVLRLQMLDPLRSRPVIDQVEQAREGIAQIETASAAMTDVEDAAHFRVQLLGVGEVRRSPANDSRVGASRLPSPVIGVRWVGGKKMAAQD